MRILVISDTHGDLVRTKEVILSQPKAEIVFHLGDGNEQAEFIKTNFKDKMVVALKGNNDWYCDAPLRELVKFGGKKIFATHGHLYNVKWGYDDIYKAARDHGAKILLFGHTHHAYKDFSDGLYVLNPGTLSGHNATYGILDITSAGIVTDIRKMI